MPAEAGRAATRGVRRSCPTCAEEEARCTRSCCRTRTAIMSVVVRRRWPPRGPAEYWDGAYVTGSDPYRASLAEAARLRVALAPGASRRLPGAGWRAAFAFSLRIRRGPPRSRIRTRRARWRWCSTGRIRFLMTGDAEAGEEEWMLAHDVPAASRRRAQGGTSRKLDEQHTGIPRCRAAEARADLRSVPKTRMVIRALRSSGRSWSAAFRCCAPIMSGPSSSGPTAGSLDVEAGGERWVR